MEAAVAAVTAAYQRAIAAALVAPLALGRTLEYVGARYGRPETWVSEFGTNIPGEDKWPEDAVRNEPFPF